MSSENGAASHPTSCTARPGYLALSVILLAVGTSVAIIQYKIPSILEPVMVRYDMTAFEGSSLMSVFTFMGVVLSLPTGVLAKRIGPKNVMLLACAIIVCGSIAGACATRAWMMVASRAIEGVAFVFITVAGPIAVEQYIPPEHQGTGNGIWSLWICIGSVIGSTITPWVFEALGLAGTWIAYALIVVGVAALLASVVKVPGPRALEVARQKISIRDLRQLLRPKALLLFFGYLMFNTEILAVLSYTPTFLQSQGMDASLSGFASSLPGLLAVIAAIAFGHLMDKTGKVKPFCLVSMVATAPATFLMLTQPGPLLWVGAFIVGLIGYGVPVACLTSLPQIAESDALLPAATSMLMLIQCLGEFLGSFLTPLFLGPAMDRWVTCGTAMCVLGFLGAAAIALCKFK